MNTLSKQTSIRLLIALGIGIALAVALNSIAIGIGVGALFVFGVLSFDKKTRINF